MDSQQQNVSVLSAKSIFVLQASHSKNKPTIYTARGNSQIHSYNKAYHLTRFTLLPFGHPLQAVS